MGNTTIWRISSELVGSGYSQHGHFLAAGICVAFGVWPVAPLHRAGIVWTYDNWRSVHLTTAHWKANIANDFGAYDEHWEAFTNSVLEEGTTCFYALWVEDESGIKRWDNNSGWNYELVYPKSS